MKCKICSQETKVIFKKLVLSKYDVSYHQCNNCSFIQTDDPYWLDEAYSSAINFSDVGLVSRNILYSEEVTAIFRMCGFDRSKKYLDYGGGYGLFVRMMRDNGFNFYWSDSYCENIFVKKFSVEDIPGENRKFEVVTAFEVFEHLVNPINEIEKMLSFSDSILFSTELIKGTIQEIENWWYIAPNHGQHTSFYSKKTLEFICNKYSLNLYSSKNLHFITKKNINRTFYILGVKYPVARLYNTLNPAPSYLQADFELYLK